MKSLRNILKPNNFQFLNQRSISSAKRQVQEIRIPVPAGYIAGKWWGPQDKRPILTFHGWQDNSGSFDRLVPHLPEDIPILAIDSPGHGFSYKLPPGMAYHNIDATIITKQIKDYFGWEKISLMGHSLGAILSYTYGYLFPKDIDFIVCIDGLHPLVNPKKLDRVSQSIEEQIKYDALNSSKEEPPSYSIQEMAERMHKATAKSVDVSTAKYILYRNIAPSKKNPGKFYFNRDARLKVGPLQVHDTAEMIRVAEKVIFPLHVTKADKSPFFGNQSLFQEINAVLKKCNKNYEFRNVPGVHHGHLNDPECVSGLITNFIRKHDQFDRSTGGLKDEMKVDESIYPMFKYKKEILGEL
ncbi:probable serine hydrolase [Onthophagus taurus]|uniref:probable serine hydrolase n=1 Tax=Onthophagus taurus TaxID=166361 RepID=UPI000C20B41C|nr:probable serine hydrolase [Onthophagus taurus]